MSDPTAPAPAAAAAAAQLPRLARFAVDSDQLTSLFPADFVRTYADLVATTDELAALRARFPDSVVEFLDRGLGDPLGIATIANIEEGALTVAEGADRIRAWQAEGRTDRVTYCSEDDLPEVIAACQGLSYWKWIASWGRMVVPEHRDAQVQFANAAMLGVHADLTVVWNPAYRPAPAAAAAAAILERGLSPLPQPASDHAAAALAADAEAKLRGLLEASQRHHGALVTIARDLEDMPALLGQHAGILSELSHLLP